MKIANFRGPRSAYGWMTGTDVYVMVSELLGAAAWKQSVRVATTENVTIATALNAGDTIDGVTLAAGDRVLVWLQTTQSENGIYEVGATPARTADFDESDEILGSFVPVRQGTTYGGALFRNTNTSVITIDTTAITFLLFLNPATRYEPVVFDNAGTPEIVFFLDAAGVWDIVMAEVPF